MRKLLVVAVLLLSPAVALAAAKGAPADLGDQGVLVPFGSVSLSYSNTGGVATLGADLSPGLLYFVIDNLAVGGNVVLSVSKPENQDASSWVGIGPEAAYHVRFNQTWSLLPQGSLDFVRNSLGGTNAPTYTTFTLMLYAPVLYRVSHFFLGFGPYLDADLYSSRSQGNISSSRDKTVAVGLRSTFGGWL
jgi:hypothetical protein